MGAWRRDRRMGGGEKGRKRGEEGKASRGMIHSHFANHEQNSSNTCRCVMLSTFTVWSLLLHFLKGI